MGEKSETGVGATEGMKCTPREVIETYRTPDGLGLEQEQKSTIENTIG